MSTLTNHFKSIKQTSFKHQLSYDGKYPILDHFFKKYHTKDQLQFLKFNADEASEETLSWIQVMGHRIILGIGLRQN